MSIVFIQLNEINFEIVQRYIDMGFKLDYLKHIYSNSIYTEEFEEYNNLEPWIQWVSCFLGKPFKEHNIFRLGDGTKLNNENIYTDIYRKLNKSCGAICPMNISSKGVNFDFFIPDPWSEEKASGSLGINLITDAIKKEVNNNTSKKNNITSKIKLLIGLIINLNPYELFRLFKFYRRINKLSFRKALFLDLTLVLLHQKLIKRKKTQFSSIFLNAGAHIQHHYFLNSNVINKKSNPEWYLKSDIDPLLEALKLYDNLIFSYKKMGYKIILMTGLQQIPTDKAEFYYRLNDHSTFIDFLGIEYDKILPRMTRDFEILFSSNYKRDRGQRILSNIIDEIGEKLFGEIEIREKSLFCTLTFNKEITKDKIFFLNKKIIQIFNWVNFVAIKNGIHDSKGYLFIDENNTKEIYNDKLELSKARDLIVNYSRKYYLAR